MDIQIPQVFFYILNFGVVAGALTYFLYKPVQKVLDDRSNLIEEGQKAAENSLQVSQKAQVQKTQLLQAAEKEAVEKSQELIKKAQQQVKEILAKAKEDGQAEVARSRVEATSEKADLIKKMHKEFELQVIKTVEKVIGSTLDKNTASKLIDEDLNALVKRI